MILNYLFKNIKEDKCIVCQELTFFQSKCECKIFICEECLLGCLGRKRQCCHCNNDIMELDIWEKYFKNDKLRSDLEENEDENRIIIRIIHDETFLREFTNLMLRIFSTGNYNSEENKIILFLIQINLQALFLESQRELLISS